MKSLFGDEPSTILTAVIAFVVVLALIAATAWLVRRFGVARLGGGRGRQPRLAVIDGASIDGRRKLIIIRRDNVEHLLMIGGPSDVVVETNIMRAAVVTQREPSLARVDTLPRAVPLPEPGGWPAQAEPVLAPRVDRPRLPEEPASMPPPIPAPVPLPMPPSIPATMRPPEPRPQPQIDPLVGLAAELSRVRQETIQRPPEPPRIPMSANFGNAEAQPAPLAPTVAPISPPSSPAAPPIAATTDAQLAEMAQRLESALRRPLGPLAPPSQRPSASANPKPLESKANPFSGQMPLAGANGPTNGTQQGNGAPARSIYEDLEQEMASLLGRQPGKS